MKHEAPRTTWRFMGLSKLGLYKASYSHTSYKGLYKGSMRMIRRFSN